MVTQGGDRLPGKLGKIDEFAEGQWNVIEN